MELSEMLSTKAQDYLSKGFFDANGKFNEGINGEYSLGMAYRCRDEGVTPDKMLKIVSQLENILGSINYSTKKHSDQRLDANTLNFWDQINQSPEVNSFPVLKEVFFASKPWITTWKTYAAFSIHLRRIMSQLALVANLPNIDKP